MTEEVPTTEVPPVEREKRHQRRVNAIVLPLVLLLSAGLTTLAIVVVVQHEQIAGLSTALAAQRRQAQQAGQTPVAKSPASVKANPNEPTISPTPVPGPSGKRGPGPSDAQVREAVVWFFTEHPVTNNTPPSAAVVQKFVDAYLLAHPAPSGSPGTNGTDGTDGTDGKPGRSVSGTACTDNHLIVSYDDGTTQDLGADSCGRGPKGDPGEPVHSYTYTVHGVGGLGDTTYLCTWDGQSSTEPHYDCEAQ